MTKTAYTRLTPRLMLQLAAPHTWAASVFPVLLATSFVAAQDQTISIITVLVLLTIAVLMQSAVNAINDYHDFVKGSDSIDDDVDVTDAVLVYNRVNPRSVLIFAIGCVVIAFVLGVYCIWRAGWIPLVLALVGAVAVFLYSGGRTPVSYLPIGEVISGMVMGGLITVASWTVLATSFDWIVLLWSVPLMVGIALMMMTNNTCDIEKDVEAGRHTLPVLLGQTNARTLYHGCILIWYVSIIVIVAVWFSGGVIVLPFMLLATSPLAKALWSNPLASHTRRVAMSQIASLEVTLGAFYCACVLASTISFVF